MWKAQPFAYFFVLVQYFCVSEALGLNVPEQMALAKTAYATNQPDKAISHLELIIREKPSFTDAYVLKGKCYIDKDLYNLALDDFTQASNRDPQESEYLYYKGMCEWKLKRVNSCISSIEKSLLYDPDNFLAYKILGSMYFELDIMNLAKENFDKAIDIQSDFSVNFFNKDKISGYTDHYKIALKALNREIKAKPTAFVGFFYRGILKAIAGDNWGAYLDFESSAKLESNQPITYYYKAYIEYSIKKFDEALLDLHKYSKKFEEDESVTNLMTIIKEIMNIKIIVEEDDSNTILTFAETMPEFKGGIKSMYEYLGQNLHYPKIATSESIEGKVVLQFVVDAKGYVNKIEVVKAIGGGCEEEAIRVVNQMPKWIPGKQNGRAVAVKYTLPIAFKLSTN
ncbi:MAG: TonB family protein [Cytophagales bacterium]